MNQKKRKLLIEFAENKCELCKKEFNSSELQIHRIKRGNKGGKYELRNIMVVCDTCHKSIHSSEF